ncbi:TonB-linked SusC/RagA family outer membrane protein [Chitinophaga skermanii]|uniref:TonB-linked SusC/RagA family outer membrane protein n=1 Tax=Chitinophaga skermanii TaxID=331697 RepID=A0A327QY44_9BACT|nr:SusC/RagA family TonB-linked outer membrane protein [Chitinophaga skermanii]RAJ08333.1 TonB-linked SusC/RagA family outer membrane protein [Chitinophaga skermanii]
MKCQNRRLSTRITQWGKYAHALTLLLLIICLSLPGKVTAQDKKAVHISNLQADKAFQELSTIYKARFYYSGSTVNTTETITIPAGKMTLDEVLQYLADQYAFAFKKNNNMISVSKKVVAPSSASAEKIIKGRVGLFDGNDVMYVPGVTIREHGSTAVTVTDDRGYFTLQLHNAPTTILLSYIGYETTQLETNNRSQINVTLKQAARSIQEVVVSTGYQTLAKKNTTGAIASITEKEIERRSSQSLTGVLEGAIPGLTMANGFSGTVANRSSTGLSIQVRGGSALQSDRTAPLIIVDGFQVAQLPQNMNDIATIDVLKDAAAAAIWGASASNGVIVITTKRGKEGKLKISYAANTYFTEKPDYAKLGRASSATMVDYDKELLDKEYIFPERWEGSKYGYTPSYDLLIKLNKGLLTPSEYAAKSDSLGRLSNLQQINDLLLQTGVRNNHYLSLSGGGKGYRFLVSGAYDYNRNTIIGNKSNNAQLNTRSDFELSPTVRISADINTVFSDSYTSPVSASNISNLAPYQMLVDNKGNYLYDYTDFNAISNDSMMKKGYYNFGKNILQDARLASNNSKSMELRTRLVADWKIVKGLTLNGTFMYDKMKTSVKNIQDTGMTATRTHLNQYANLVNNAANFNLPKGNILNTSESNAINWAFRTQLNYTNTFNKKHFVNVLAGLELKKFVTDGYNTRRYGYNDQLLSWMGVDEKTLLKGGLRWWDNSTIPIYDATNYNNFNYNDTRHASYYSTLAYTYDGKYTFTGSYRIDQSNLFGTDPKYRSSPLWSIGGSWDIAQESFMTIKNISLLKLRATVGLTGNFDKTTTPVLVATQRQQANLNDFALRMNYYNPKLRWERTRTVNLGVDVGMYNNRLQVTIDAYNKYGYDLFGSSVLDPTVGVASLKINAASMRNKGIEFNIQGNIIEQSNFRWNSRLNFAYNKNIVLESKLPDSNPASNRPSGTTPYVQGYGRETLWSYRWAGLDEKGNPLVYGDKDEKIKVPVMSSLMVSGVYRAPYVGGFTNVFTYRDFFASVFATYNFGNVMRREMPNMDGYAGAGNLNYQIANRWRKPGDELTTDIPSIQGTDDMMYDGRTRVALYSSNSVMPGDFIRLKEIQLGYSLPATLLRKSAFKGVHFIAQMNNVALWAKNKYGLDPEAIDPVLGAYSLPSPKITTFTVRVEL